jgi:hypothetical protein
VSNIAKRFWSNDLEGRLQRAVEAYDLPGRPEFDRLSELSQRTEFKGIEVHASAAVLSGEVLYAPATIHVTLNYGENGEEDQAVLFSDTYPARVKFSMHDDNFTVEAIEVDTSSFFE